MKTLERMTTDTIIEMVNKYATGNKYLEIGVYRGGLISEIWSKFSLGIDNFSQFNAEGDNKESALQKIAKKNILLVDGDCFDQKVREKVSQYATFDVFLYDGNHGFAQTADAIELYHEFMADEYILIMDDWNESNVRSGTFSALYDIKFRVLEQHLTEKNGSPDYWNGIAVLKVTK